jgi:hypothetical protein
MRLFVYLIEIYFSIQNNVLHHFSATISNNPSFSLSITLNQSSALVNIMSAPRKYKLVANATYTNKRTGKEHKIPNTTPDALQQRLIQIVENDRDAPQHDKDSAISEIPSKIAAGVEQAKHRAETGEKESEGLLIGIAAGVIVIAFVIGIIYLAGGFD